MDSPEYAEDVISVMRCVITQFTVKDLESESIEVPVHVKLWRVNGCHELLASLGKRGGSEGRWEGGRVGMDELRVKYEKGQGNDCEAMGKLKVGCVKWKRK